MTMWCGFWFGNLWCGLLSFSFRAFLFDFDLRPFWWVPSVMKSILVTLRHFYFPCCRCPSFGVVDFVDFEVLIYFLQCSFWDGIDLFGPRGTSWFVSFVCPLYWWSRFCWPRGINLFFTVLFVEESMFLDPEARIYFLQCTSFGGVDLFDPEAQIYFLQCTFFSGVDLFDPEASV